MPKKTKRQKMTADLRRRAPRIPRVASSDITDIHPQQPVYQFNDVVFQRKKEAITEDAADLGVIKADLTKTIIFSIIIIGIEIGAYWYLRIR